MLQTKAGVYTITNKRMSSQFERNKIAKGLLGKKHSEVTKLKMANTRTGMRLSEETKAKISASHRRRLQSV